MVPALRPFAQAKQSVGKLFSVIRKNGSNAYWTIALKVTQEAMRIGRCLTVVDADKDPAGSPIDRDEKVTARGFISHLR